MEIRFVPIEKWPGALSTHRRPAPFRAGYSDTLKVLDRELSAIRTRAVVVQLALLPGDLRRDGLPRVGSRPSHPGVILSFETPQPRVGADPAKRYWTPLSFPCDTYSEWQDNLRAIALALEALRKVDRYGVTKTGEQYRGWAQLPPPGGIVTPSPMTVEQAAAVVAGSSHHNGSLLMNADAFRMAYRDRAKVLHPDANEGKHLPEWDVFQRAADVLKKHHGI